MQTFLPSPSPDDSARILDSVRLNKQRLEGLQILGALADPTRGYANHPAIVMWRGRTEALACWYLAAICDECDRRGIADNTQMRQRIMAHSLTETMPAVGWVLPWWVSTEALHLSHRRNLAHKHESYARMFGAEIGEKPPYVWPVHADEYEANDTTLTMVTRYVKPRKFLGTLGPPDAQGSRLFSTRQANGVAVAYLLEKQG